jgi:predicted aspartyl protease
MKYQNLVCALLYLALLPLFAAVPGRAESPQKVTVSMRPYKGIRAVVAVKVNGAGPYDFMVDTGATITVLDTALFHELGLQAMGSSRIVSAAGATNQVLSQVNEITLDGLSVQNVKVVSMRSPLQGSDDRAVRGVLGENFLRHFDILFDNQDRTMTLDAAGGLADSLTGERLPTIFPPLPREDENRYQPRISVELQGYGRARFLLDSGATEFILVQWGNPSSLGDTRIRTVNGSLACESTHKRVHLGKGTVSNLPMVSCQSATVRAQDSEGILPTGLFKQVFISHGGSYAILNPQKRGNLPLEMAAVTPLLQ